MFSISQRGGARSGSALATALLMLAGVPQIGLAEGCMPGTHTFCVTNTNDTTDTGSPNYAGSLRKAIADSNAEFLVDVSTNTIGFDISGAGPHTINLSSGVGFDLASNVIIDGYSQIGSVLNTNTPDQGGSNAQLMIEIVGLDTGKAGFGRSSAATNLTWTFQGLAMHNLNVAIAGQNGTTTPKTQINVYGCFIGTKIDGTALGVLGTGNAAVIGGFDNLQIGGNQAWQRNVLSGSGGAGVFASPSDASSSVIIEGNLIGTDASGTTAIPNGTANNWPGVWIQGKASHVRIGCAATGCASHASRNIISGNRPWGITLSPDVGGLPYDGLLIQGNYIGVAWNGSALPNGWSDAPSKQYGGGIQVSDSSNTTPAIIGGFADGEANVIAFNHGPGINLLNTTGYFDTRANQVHDNDGVGTSNIALGAFSANEPLANDTDDADVGSNFHQNFPEIVTAEPLRQSGQRWLKVTYRVRSAPANATYPIRVDFHFAVNGGTGLWFAEDMYPSSAGQGYVTSTLQIQDTVPGGTPWWSFWGPIVATATDGAGRSSEISPVTDDWIFGDGGDGAG